MKGVLSPREVDAFFHDGFIVLPELFAAEEVERIALEFDRLLERRRGLDKTTVVDGSLFVIEDGQIKRIVWCCGAAPALERWAADPRLLRPVFQLLAPPDGDEPDRIDQLICQAHFKLPRDGVAFPWHQDAQHRRYGTPEWRDVNGRGSYVQTVLAVDAMDVDNGPLQLVRGSCRAGPLPPDEVERQVAPADLVTLRLTAGSVAMFGPYTIHGSQPNCSDRPRRAWINGYAAPGANARDYPGCGRGRVRVRPSRDSRSRGDLIPDALGRHELLV